MEYNNRNNWHYKMSEKTNNWNNWLFVQLKSLERNYEQQKMFLFNNILSCSLYFYTNVFVNTKQYLTKIYKENNYVKSLCNFCAFLYTKTYEFAFYITPEPYNANSWINVSCIRKNHIDTDIDENDNFIDISDFYFLPYLSFPDLSLSYMSLSKSYIQSYFEKKNYAYHEQYFSLDRNFNVVFLDFNLLLKYFGFFSIFFFKNCFNFVSVPCPEVEKRDFFDFLLTMKFNDFYIHRVINDHTNNELDVKTSDKLFETRLKDELEKIKSLVDNYNMNNCMEFLDEMYDEVYNTTDDEDDMVGQADEEQDNKKYAEVYEEDFYKDDEYDLVNDPVDDGLEYEQEDDMEEDPDYKPEDDEEDETENEDEEEDEEDEEDEEEDEEDEEEDEEDEEDEDEEDDNDGLEYESENDQDDKEFNKTICFEQSDVNFILIEYIPENTKTSVEIVLPRNHFIVGNEILSTTFIMKYFKTNIGINPITKMFDLNYEIRIIDDDINQIVLKNNQYIRLAKKEYMVMNDTSR
jgi:hypothetical protein